MHFSFFVLLDFTMARDDDGDDGGVKKREKSGGVVGKCLVPSMSTVCLVEWCKASHSYQVSMVHIPLLAISVLIKFNPHTHTSVLCIL